MRGRGHRRRNGARRVDVLEDRREQLLAEARAVGVVRRLAFATPADPVRHFLEHDGVPDQQLDEVRLIR